MKAICVGLTMSAAMAGCGSMLQDSTNRAQTYAQNAFVGQPATAFFALHGLPFAKLDSPDGTIYEWQAGEQSFQMPATTTATSTLVGGQIQTSALTTGGGSLTIFCRARILTDKDGRISSFRITGDTVGAWALSRCAEVLK